MLVIMDKVHRVDFHPSSVRWNQQNPPAQFCVTRIANRNYFVKRQKTMFSGWGLLVKAISEEQIRYAPKVLAIARDQEHYYFFTEKIEGNTLEELFRNGSHTPKTPALVHRLFVALYNINRHGFWYSDLCRRNIFVDRACHYYLIDVDSCVPHTVPFSYRKVAFEYPPILIEFANSTRRNATFHIVGLPGACVNQAELIALAMDAKTMFSIPIDRKASVLHGMLLRKLGTRYSNLLADLTQGRSNWAMTRQLVDSIVALP